MTLPANVFTAAMAGMLRQRCSARSAVLVTGEFIEAAHEAATETIGCNMMEGWHARACRPSSTRGSKRWE
jgi:hypothetical protein